MALRVGRELGEDRESSGRLSLVPRQALVATTGTRTARSFPLAGDRRLAVSPGVGDTGMFGPHEPALGFRLEGHG